MPAKKLKNEGVHKMTASVPSRGEMMHSQRINREAVRHRRGPLTGVWGFIMWLVGILVSLAVGFGMVDGTLKVPFIPFIVMVAAGWIVVVLILLGVLLKMIDLMSW